MQTLKIVSFVVPRRITTCRRTWRFASFLLRRSKDLRGPPRLFDACVKSSVFYTFFESPRPEGLTEYSEALLRHSQRARVNASPADTFLASGYIGTGSRDDMCIGVVVVVVVGISGTLYY